MPEGRIAELATPLELPREELGHGVAGGQRDRARVGRERLDDHAPRPVAPAPPGELRDELEGPLLGTEVGNEQPCVGVDDRRKADTREVVPLRHHLRSQQDRAIGGGEALEDACVGAVPRGCVRVEPKELELGKSRRQLLLEPLGAGADAGELRGSAHGTERRRGAHVPAVMAVQAAIGVEDERDVAGRTPLGAAARPAVQRRRRPATVEEQHGLPTPGGHTAQLGQQRGAQRVPGLAAEVDDTHRRQRPVESTAELEPLEPVPALGPGRRAAEHAHRALELGSAKGNTARVVARVGVLLVGGILLLVDADEPQSRQRREDRRACADHDRRLAGRDAFPLVAPLRLRQSRVEASDAVSEAVAEAGERLRREGDLGNEDDRAEPALEGGGTGPQVDLRLATAGLAVKEEAPAGADRLHDAGEGCILRLGQRGGSLLGRKVHGSRPTALAAPGTARRGDQRERARGRRPVVGRDPEREIDERTRDTSEHLLDADRLHARGDVVGEGNDDPAAATAAEGNGDDVAGRKPVAEVGERPVERACRDERDDLGEGAHAPSLARAAGGLVV